MEPFELTLHQVNFDESAGFLPSNELESFGNIVNYDSQYDFALDSISCNSVKTGVKHQKETERQSFPNQSCVCDTEVHSVWSEKYLNPPHQQFLVNPYENLHSSSEKGKIVTSDIRTLAQVSANTSSLSAHLKRKKNKQTVKMPTEEQGQVSRPSEDNPELGSTFETVAEALHLQWSVIGNKNLTPASPEVVAQIVAQAEKQIKSSSQKAMPVRDAIHHSPSMHEPPVRLAADKEMQLEKCYQTKPSIPTKKSLNCSNNAQESCGENSTELIRIPAGSLEMMTEKASWFGSVSKKSSEKEKSKSKERTSNKTTSESLPSLKDENNSSMYEDIEPDHADDNISAEAFLRSLPPVKVVELEAFLKRIEGGRSSPPVKEMSFRPEMVTRDAGVLENNNVDISKYSPPTRDVTDSKNKVNIDLPEKDTSSSIIPFVPLSQRPPICLPDPGPLFRKPLTLQSKISLPLQDVMPAKTNGINFEEVLREKAKLEGQLEVLSTETQVALQERAELQAHMASLKQKLLSAKGSGSEVEKEALKADIESLKNSRMFLEQSIADAHKLLEEKAEEIKRLDEELKQAQETTDKLNLKIREIRDELRTKDVTVQALKNKVAELYVEVQLTLQSKMQSDAEARMARNDLTSLLSTKDWYHEQLQLANKTRSTLQQELTMFQAQVISQGMIIERLKAETSRLRQQLTEIQQKAIKEKETLARQLENIEADMFERETAFQEIQRERRLIEETFDSNIQTVEKEKSRLMILMQSTAELEAQLDKAQNNLKKKQVQIFSLETEQANLMKRLTVSEGNMMEKEKIIEELEQKLIDLETKLNAFQSSLSAKDSEVLKLKEEKASVEIALASALEEKKSFDSALGMLRGDLSKVEKSFWQMKQELNNKVMELESEKQNKAILEEDLQKQSAEFEKQKLANFQYKEVNVTTDVQKLELKNSSLEAVVTELRQELTVSKDLQLHMRHEKEALEKEVAVVKVQLAQNEAKLEDEEKIQTDMTSAGDGIKKELMGENNALRQKLASLEKKLQGDFLKQKAKVAKLNSDLTKVQNELMDRQKTYDLNTELLASKLQEVIGEKEQLQTEVDILKRKFDLSMLEQQDQMKVELQALASELQQVQVHKQQLEVHITKLDQIRNQDVEQYQQHLAALEQQLHHAAEESKERENNTGEMKQQLVLELEKERGRLTGLQQSNAALKQHVAELEEALARRESSLVDLQMHFQATITDREEGDLEYIRRIQILEETLKENKDGQRDLRKQIGAKITENKRLKRQHQTLGVEHEQWQFELQQKTQELHDLQVDLKTKKEAGIEMIKQLQKLQADNQALRLEVERLQRDLADKHNRNPVIEAQIQSLQWQLEQKTKEVESVQLQLRLVEERQHEEMENRGKTLQLNQTELEMLKTELNNTKKEKMIQQSKVAELRSALKASVQHHKLNKKMHSKIQGKSEHKSPNSRDTGTQVTATDMKEPPVEQGFKFDVEALEKLLQDTAVQALESRPLGNLQSCLSGLRAEISSLQQQIDVHTVTVETSSQSWRCVENQVEELREVVKTVSSTSLNDTLTTTLSKSSSSNGDEKPMELIDV